MQKNVLSRVIRALAIVAVVCVGSDRADAQTLTPLWTYRYGSYQNFFYTTNFNELGGGGGGWVYLGAKMKVYDSEASGTIPLYRFYSPTYGKHFYSTNINEVSPPDWEYIGVAGYIWPSEQPGTQAIRRWFKWVDGPVHLYTFYNAAESDQLVSEGWEFEGIIGYTAPCTVWAECY